MYNSYTVPISNQVRVLGAIRAGLLIALLLGRHGEIHITVLEAWDKLDECLRPTQYGTPASRIFREAGVLGEIHVAMITDFKGICWRCVKRNGERLTGVDLNLTKDDADRVTVLPLIQILEILCEHCFGQETVEIRLPHRVAEFEQDGNGGVCGC